MIFRDRLLVELIKAKHDNGLLNLFDAKDALRSGSVSPSVVTPQTDRSAYTGIATTHDDTSEKLVLSHCLQWVDQSSIDAVNRYNRKMALSALLISVIMLLFGALSTAQLLSPAPLSHAGQMVNVFWLLLLLLGLSTLMLGIWLVMMLLRSSAQSPGIMMSLTGQIAKWIFTRFSHLDAKRFDNEIKLLSINIKPPHARWLLSLISHLAWSGFLLGGLLTLIMILLTRQIDFVWESTLLNHDTFTSLTLMLGYPGSLSGLSMPDEQTLLLSRLGMPPEQVGSVRMQWAYFLLVSVFAYGLLPRLLLAALSATAYLRARERYRLDLNDPVYHQLLQQLTSPSRHKGVIDPDLLTQAGMTLQAKQVDATQPLATSAPDLADWIGLELESDCPWPPLALRSERWLATVNTREEQAAALLELQQPPFTPSPLVIATALRRTPDRGLERFIRQAAASGRTLWLGLYRSAAEQEEYPTRLNDWLALAARCQIPPHHIFLLDKAHSS